MPGLETLIGSIDHTGTLPFPVCDPNFDRRLLRHCINPGSPDGANNNVSRIRCAPVLNRIGQYNALT